MASLTTRQHPHSWGLRLAVVLAFAAAVVGVCAQPLLDGYLGDAHAQFLAEALVLVDRGRFELSILAYPPLPLILLVVYPAVIAPICWGALFTGALAESLARSAAHTQNYARLWLLGLLFLTPLAFTLSIDHFYEAMGLWLLFLAWRRWTGWLRTDITGYAFRAGLLIALAEYVTPLALLLALSFGAVLPLFRPLSMRKFLSVWLVLVFPPLISRLTIVGLGAIFTGAPAWSYRELIGQVPALVDVLMVSPLYLLVGAALLFARPRGRTLAYGLPLAALAVAAGLGLKFSLPFAVALLCLTAVGALPPRMPRRVQVGLAAAVLIQGIVLWSVLPWSVESPAARASAEQAVAEALRQRPDGSVLTDPETTARLVARTGTARPFVVPIDPGYPAAALTPAAFVDYILIGSSASLAQQYGDRNSRHFAPVWAGADYRLYRRADTPATAPDSAALAGVPARSFPRDVR